MGPRRRLLLVAPVLLPMMISACGDSPALRDYPPLRYDFLNRLQLNVGVIDYAPLPAPSALDGLGPFQAAAALKQMVEDRLTAGGSSGTALVTIEDASLVRVGRALDGSMALRLDIMSADGNRVGFAEARVARHIDDPGGDLKTALYDMTKQMLDDMNVEFEFQLRRSLRDYLQTVGSAPAPVSVQQQDLNSPVPAGLPPTSIDP